MNDTLVEALLKLTPAERIQLAEDLWDSVAAEPERLPALSEARRQEIERRLADHDRAPNSAISWEDVRARPWAKLG